MSHPPYLYQLQHPWHWLTYAQNATALGIVLAAILSILSIYVLTRTLRAVNKQAIAADRQAEAAEEQVAAAKSSAAVSDAQRIATEQSAAAERAHNELIRIQTLASMRPFVGVDRRPHPTMSGTWHYFAFNHGEGVALDVKFSYLDTPNDAISISHNILGPGQSAFLGLSIPRVASVGLQARYISQDGRFFVTKIRSVNQDFIHETFEVNENGGWLAQPTIPTSA